MIFKVEIENFFSIRDRQVMDLRVSDKVPHEPARFHLVYPGSLIRAPKVVVIFGPNAAGKTTILRALAFLAWFVRDSFQLRPEVPMPFEPFRNADDSHRTTKLALSFGGATNLADTDDASTTFGTYHYELCIAPRVNQPSVVSSEILTHRVHGTRKSARVFERRDDGQVIGSKAFSLGGLGSVVERIRSNASVISTLAQFEHPAALTLSKAAQTVATNLFLIKQEYSDAQVAGAYGSSKTLLDALNREIGRIDVGVRGMEVLSDLRGPSVQFQHEGLSYPVPWYFESHGTQSFVRLFPLISSTLSSGGVAVIDELDASLHPHMLAEIAKWFYDPARNVRGAQLWSTCQNAAFLDELNKEEIFFCEKNSKGMTKVYGLQEIKNIRRIDNFYRKYLSGTYGAIPNIG